MEAIGFLGFMAFAAAIRKRRQCRTNHTHNPNIVEYPILGLRVKPNGAFFALPTRT